jgi:hypothetical protein
VARPIPDRAREVLLDLAGELAVMEPHAFDPRRFSADRIGDAAKQAFAADLHRARALRIGRLPTFVVCGRSVSRIAVDHWPAAAIEAMIAAAAADINAPPGRRASIARSRRVSKLNRGSPSSRRPRPTRRAQSSY